MLMGAWWLNQRGRVGRGPESDQPQSRGLFVKRIAEIGFSGSYVPSSVWEAMPKRTTAALLLTLGLLLWAFAFTVQSSSTLRVAVLDVGQGNAILITTPSGRQVLVDGGPEPRAVLRALGQQMSFWDKSLDMVVLTHPDQDHVGGLAGVLRSYRAGLVLQSGPTS
ncbi:MAG: MBL fold metallo-hydrolase, partial [SAR202 cluster bacterium]|nr:MBL fold metallo-hydrolase [SAR202 cluster bacterium]